MAPSFHSKHWPICGCLSMLLCRRLEILVGLHLYAKCRLRIHAQIRGRCFSACTHLHTRNLHKCAIECTYACRVRERYIYIYCIVQCICNVYIHRERESPIDWHASMHVYAQYVRMCLMSFLSLACQSGDWNGDHGHLLQSSLHGDLGFLVFLPKKQQLAAAGRALDGILYIVTGFSYSLQSSKGSLEVLRLQQLLLFGLSQVCRLDGVVPWELQTLPSCESLHRWNGTTLWLRSQVTPANRTSSNLKAPWSQGVRTTDLYIQDISLSAGEKRKKTQRRCEFII